MLAHGWCSRSCEVLAVCWDEPTALPMENGINRLLPRGKRVIRDFDMLGDMDGHLLTEGGHRCPCLALLEVDPIRIVVFAKMNSSCV